MPPSRASTPTTPSKPNKSTAINAPVASNTTTILLFLALLVAFFPSIFHYIWSIPLGFLFSFSQPSLDEHPTSNEYYQSNMWFQKQFTLPAKSRGSYLITDTVLQELPQIKQYKVGLLNLFIQHTSCALSLNENWDSVCTIISEGEGVAGSTSLPYPSNIS